MKNVSEDLCEGVRDLLTTLRCSSVQVLDDSLEHVVSGEMVCVWHFLLKYCRPSYEICELKNRLAGMTKQQELKNHKKKVNLKKILARKKKLNCKCERDVMKLVTKHCHADRDIVDARKASRETENKVFLLQCKALEVEQELKLFDENCNFISKYVCGQDAGSRRMEFSPLSCVVEALDQVKTARLRLSKESLTKERDKHLKDGQCDSVGKALCRDIDADSLWQSVFCLLDQAGQQVEQIIVNRHSESGTTDRCCELELSKFRLQFVELVNRVVSMERNTSASDNISFVKSASVKLLKNWLLVHHPGDSQSFNSILEDFVDLSIHHEHLASIRKHYLSLQSKCCKDSLSSMVAEVEMLLKQREAVLLENVTGQSQINDVLALCSSVVHDVRWSVCNSSVELSKYSNTSLDFTNLGMLAEEVFSLWTRELEMFMAFPLQTIDGIHLHSKRSTSRVLCSVTLRTRNPFSCLNEKVMALYSSMMLLPPEAAAIKLANLLAFRASRRGRQQCVNKLSLLPRNNVTELRLNEEEILSSNYERLECVCQSLVALEHSFEDNEKNLLFWTSQPLSSVAKTMVVNGRTFEEFQQVRNMSSLCKSSSVQSGLNKLKSFHSSSFSFRKRTDSL